MPSKEFHGESSAFLRLLDLEQMSRAFDEAVVIAALDPERLVAGPVPAAALMFGSQPISLTGPPNSDARGHRLRVKACA